MLKQCIDLFKKEYAVRGDSLILENYGFSQGTYVLVNRDGEISLFAENIRKKRKKEEPTIEEKRADEENQKNLKKFACYDYNSSLLTLLKPVDKYKIIHSNNYLSFFVKKENLGVNSGVKKITTKIIEEYYDKFEKPTFSDENERDLYHTIANQIGPVDQDRLFFVKQWILENINDIMSRYSDQITDDKTYLKIFFEADETLIKNEGARYFVPHIFNANKYNQKSESSGIIGVPNDNMGMNEKKINLKTHLRKTVSPKLISIEEAMLQRTFFIYLYNFVVQKKYNIYFTEEGTQGFENKEVINIPSSGFYMRLDQDNGHVVIKEYAAIGPVQQRIRPMIYEETIPENLDREDTHYGKIKTMEEIQFLIERIFFKNCLMQYLYMDEQNININDMFIKRKIITEREAYQQWFMQGNDLAIKNIINRSSMDFTLNAIQNDKFKTAIIIYNLRVALLDYFRIRPNRTLRSEIKITIDQIHNMDLIVPNDNTFLFMASQLVKYTVPSEKKLFYVKNLLAMQRKTKIKNYVNQIYEKYAGKQREEKFKIAYYAFALYSPETETVDKDMLISGYLMNCKIYFK